MSQNVISFYFPDFSWICSVCAHNSQCVYTQSRELEKLSKPPVISRVVGREVLDSRGNPTVEADIYCTVRGEEILVARSGAPSGASTGSNEAHELRDKDSGRFLGKGTKTASANVSEALNKVLKGADPCNLAAVDKAMCDADGTELKTNLGGNALTAVSFAAAEAGAKLANQELYAYFAKAFGKDTSGKFSMPRPMVNILNGGKHAGGNLKIQEFMIVPKQAAFADMLQSVTEVYHNLGKILVAKHGLSSKNLGDEGGFAPNLDNAEQALTLIEEAITAAGYTAGEDMFLALDCAASEFYDAATSKYNIAVKQALSTAEMVDFYVKLQAAHPALISIEDGLDEKDYEGWKLLTEKLGSKIMLVGDDLYTTNTNLIKQGVAEEWANALLLKVNQIGTISESMAAARMIFGASQNVIVSHRSGETVSAIIADLAVGIGAGFIKTGATARGERISKYNRLLQIEESLREQNLLA